MKATIFSHTTVIGTADLRINDSTMGGVYGDFLPNDYYYQHIQKEVWKFWESDKIEYEAWHRLRFNAQLENGCFLYAAGGFTFDDSPGFPKDPKHLSLAGLDDCALDYFREERLAPFVEEPWCAITIEQKIVFEEELKKELGIIQQKSFLHFFRKIFHQENILTHPLSEFEIFALCKDQRNDDVLFITRNSTSEKRFAVVHLTWKGKTELKGFPSCTFYNDFDAFKNLRMYPDRNEWED